MRLAQLRSQWRQIGLSQSDSRWVSHVATLTSGGPLPCIAYARRAPSAAVVKPIWVVDKAGFPERARFDADPAAAEENSNGGGEPG